MFSMLANLATSFLGWYVRSPLAKQIVATVVSDLKSEGQRVLPVAIEAIKVAAEDANLTNKGKFDYVVGTVIAQAPSVEHNLVNGLIDLAYRTLKNDPEVSEVQ